MTLSSGAPLSGRSALGSKTVWSGILGIVTFFLPAIFKLFGVPIASQGVVVADINQFGPPLFSLLAIIFRMSATKQITAILPGKAPPLAMRVFAWLLIVPLVMIIGAGTLSLAACATPTAQEVVVGTETGGELTYVVIAEGCKAYIAAPGTSAAGAAAATADWRQAWALLGQIRSASASGQSVAALIDALLALQHTASVDTGGTVKPPPAAGRDALIPFNLA